MPPARGFRSASDRTWRLSLMASQSSPVRSKTMQLLCHRELHWLRRDLQSEQNSPAVPSEKIPVHYALASTFPALRRDHRKCPGPSLTKNAVRRLNNLTL